MWHAKPKQKGDMTMREALNGSEDDRKLWKWERLQEDLHMADVYKGKPAEAGWRAEADRYREMLNPKLQPA